MDKTTLVLAVDSSQVGTAAAAFERMVGAGNAAAAAGGKVTAGATAQGRSILTTLVPAATKGKAAYNELAAAAERLDARLAQPKTPVAVGAVKPQLQPVSTADPVTAEPKAKRTRKTATPDSADASATGVAKLGAESKKTKTSLDGLTTSARGTGNALTTLTSRARAAADAVKSISAAPIKAPAGIAAIFDAANKASPTAFNQVTAAMAVTAAQAARTAAAVADANRAISAPVQIRVTTAAPSARTPLAATSPLSRATGLPAPTAGNVAQLAGDAGRAQTAVERLTAAARNQRSALTQLAPAAAATAVSYRQLANTPITLAAPQGLSSAAAALSNATTQANAARVAIAGLNATRAPAAQSQASGALGAAGARAATQQNNALAVSARQAAFQQQQLAFQLNDFFVQVASGGSPLTALIQQGSQLSGTFGGVGGAFRAVTGLLTPARLAFGGVATAVGALGLAFHESQQRGYAFAQAVALSGNFSGQTEGKVNALAQAVSRQGQATQSDVREMAQALIAIGNIGPESFDKATEAAIHYQHATSKTAEEVAKDFADIARAPTKAAASLSAVTASQYKEIRALEENGEKAKAATIVYSALTAEFEKLNGKLPFFSERLKFLSKDFDNLRNALAGVFNPTVEQQIGKLEASLASLRRSDSMDWRTLLGLDKSGAIGEFQGKIDQLRGQKKTADDKAKGEASEQDKNNKGKVASDAVRTLLDQANPQRVFDRESAALKKKFADGAAVGQPVSAADQVTAMAQLKKSIMPAKAKGGSEASQVLRAQLDQDIKGIQQVLARESDAIAFQNRFLQGEYQAGTISLMKFYDERRANTESSVNARIAALDKEAAREAQYLSASKDPSDKKRSQTRLNDIESEKADLRERAAQDVSLSNQEEAASFKALNDQVTNYRANLLQMQGDEAGAARLRAQSAITAAQMLSQQGAGLSGAPSAAEVFQMARKTEILIQYNEVQRHASILANNSARAEEAFGAATEQSGKSLAETERGIFEIRSQELAQLGALAAKAKELADASTIPAVKEFAADLALQYAKAAAAIDPALNRLRDANRELASGLASTAGNGPNAIAQEYTRRRLDANDDIRRQRDEYSRKIDMLEGYLATTQDKNDKARLRAQIKDAEGKRDSVKGESRGSSVFKAINEAVIQPMAAQVFQTVNKLLITDPLQEYLKGQLNDLTQKDGALAGVFKDALGIKASPKDAATALQTAAIDANRAAMNALTQAAQAAAAALSTPIPAAGEALPAGASARPAEAGSEASDSLLAMSRTASAAASDVSRLAAAAGLGGDAMGRLPAIVSLFQSAAAAMSTSSAGSSAGGIFGAIAGLFSGADAGGIGYEAAVASTGIFHQGGIVGSPPATRSVASSVFAGAAKYHTGGIAGLKADEVPAILMGGRKGKREEVLTADDPRHRDNLGMNALAKIMAESKHEGMRVRGARELGGPVSANSMYRVNEKGPELLQVAGKQYLMTGSQGGSVQPNQGGGKNERPVVVNNNFALSAPTNHASQSQISGAAARGVQRGLRNN